jgi:hypothetical protein
MEKTLMTNENLAAKIGWEGGVIETLDYGLRSDEIADPELRALWVKAQQHFKELRFVADKIEEALGEYLP